MTILRHSQIAVTMDIYNQASAGVDQGGIQAPRHQFGEGIL